MRLLLALFALYCLLGSLTAYIELDQNWKQSGPMFRLDGLKETINYKKDLIGGLIARKKERMSKFSRDLRSWFRFGRRQPNTLDDEQHDEKRSH